MHWLKGKGMTMAKSPNEFLDEPEIWNRVKRNRLHYP